MVALKIHISSALPKGILLFRRFAGNRKSHYQSHYRCGFSGVAYIYCFRIVSLAFKLNSHYFCITKGWSAFQAFRWHSKVKFSLGLPGVFWGFLAPIAAAWDLLGAPGASWGLLGAPGASCGFLGASCGLLEMSGAACCLLGSWGFPAFSCGCMGFSWGFLAPPAASLYLLGPQTTNQANTQASKQASHPASQPINK